MKARDGRISRVLFAGALIVVMDFPNKVPQDQIDTNLLYKIKDSKTPAIIRTAALAYDWAVENYGGMDRVARESMRGEEEITV